MFYQQYMKLTTKEKNNLVRILEKEIKTLPKSNKEKKEFLEDIILKLDVNAFYRYMGL